MCSYIKHIVCHLRNFVLCTMCNIYIYMLYTFFFVFLIITPPQFGERSLICLGLLHHWFNIGLGDVIFIACALHTVCCLWVCVWLLYAIRAQSRGSIFVSLLFLYNCARYYAYCMCMCVCLCVCSCVTSMKWIFFCMHVCA